ncbi:MAG: hypothetical protein ACNA8J_10250 [Gammaproteobacteria bacterium]
MLKYCCYAVSLALLLGLGGAAQARGPDAGAWVLSGHVGSVEVDRLVRDKGAWWAEVDDRRPAFGLALSHEPLSMFGMRLLYERAQGVRSTNRCPDNGTCPAILIREEVDLEAWQFVLVPRLQLGRNISLFGTLGALYWELNSDDLLPGDSGTDFVYGAGLTWLGARDIEIGLEFQAADVDYRVLRLNLGLRF